MAAPHTLMFTGYSRHIFTLSQHTNTLSHHPPWYCGFWDVLLAYDIKLSAAYRLVAVVLWTCHCVCLSCRVHRPPSSQADESVYFNRPSHTQHTWLMHCVIMMASWPVQLGSSDEGVRKVKFRKEMGMS